MEFPGSTTERVTLTFDDGIELTVGQIAYLVQEAIKEAPSLCRFVYRTKEDKIQIGCSSTFTTDNGQVAPTTDGPDFVAGTSHHEIAFVTPKDTDWHDKPIDTDCFPAAIVAGLRLFRDHVIRAYVRIKADGIPELELTEA